MGVEPGSRVAVQLPNSLDWLRATLGALRAGLTVVPINTAYTDPELEYVLTDSSASLLVAAAERAEVAGVRVCAGPPTADGPPPDVADDPAAVSFLCYTSGTTGRPRGAMLPAAALRANQEQCLAMEPPVVREDDRVLLVLPLFHVYGLNAGFGLVAATGACAVLLETFDPRRSLAVMAEEHITAVPGAPPMYQAWLAAADAVSSDADLRRAFASMRMASSGAAPLPEEVWTAMRERADVTVWEGYGLTEAAPVVASTLATGRAKPNCIGGALPGLELQLRDTAAGGHHHDDGEDHLEGPGEIWIRGPNLFSGYWPDGAGGPDAEGWFRTGDVGFLDSDGDLHLVDRVSDVVIVNGFNVFPREVEQVLLEHPGVTEAAVVGIPDERAGEAVKAVLVPAEDAELTVADVLAHCATRLARFKVPTVIEFVDALPRSATGKIDRRALR
jgi:long-chain acyl-CoA synthetase